MSVSPFFLKNDWPPEEAKTSSGEEVFALYSEKLIIL
jgi:hypothetical protein